MFHFIRVNDKHNWFVSKKSLLVISTIIVAGNALPIAQNRWFKQMLFFFEEF